MQRRWKQVLCSLLGVLLLAGSLLTVPAAAAETTAPQTTAAESTDDAKDKRKYQTDRANAGHFHSDMRRDCISDHAAQFEKAEGCQGTGGI